MVQLMDFVGTIYLRIDVHNKLLKKLSLEMYI